MVLRLEEATAQQQLMLWFQAINKTAVINNFAHQEKKIIINLLYYILNKNDCLS